MAPASVPLPPSFLERMQRLLGSEYPDFAESLQGPAIHGLRVNTLKLSAQEFQAISPFPLGSQVPWCGSAFLLEGEDRPGKHPYHLAGLYYLQDPSAMSAATLLDPRPGEWVLDLAAAPGGKTTQIAALMKGEGFLLVNEIKTKRLNHLIANVERWGATNIVVTNETPERLADHFGAIFDRVLVDAPCSGEGMFRRDAGARLDWSEEMVAGCAIRQRNILRVAAHLVRPGGYLLYSTCTFAPEEDEGVILRFLSENPDFEIDEARQFPGFMPGRPEWLPETARDEKLEDTLHKAVRLFPHRVAGEGHFVCRLQRKGTEPGGRIRHWQPDKLPAGLMKTWQLFKENCFTADFPTERLKILGDRLFFVPEDLPEMDGLRVSLFGVCLGNFKKERFEPAHSLALALRRGEAANQLDLPVNSPEMASYLRGETLISEGAPGWTLVTVDGWPIGWGKLVQGILKNHFPHSWMVLSS
jgi:NOL1/NOP2/sun family putative RNA methylase